MKVIRVNNGILSTPVVKYRRGDSAITAIGVIHIGEKRYYHQVQKALDSVSYGFYEGVRPVSDLNSVPESRQKYLAQFTSLGETYRTLAAYLDLVAQKDNLTYADGWRNPDITLDQLIVASPEKVLKKFSRLPESMEKMRLYHEADPLALARVVKGASMFMFKYLGLAITTMNWSWNKVILDQRNQTLFEALEPDLEKEELGIIYGAAHLKGIDRYLRKNGFKQEGAEWLQAWELDQELSFSEALKRISTVQNKSKK